MRRGQISAATLGAKIYAGQGDAAVLRAGEPREAFFSTFYRPNDAPHPTDLDVELKGGEWLDFGDVQVRALATPGHTPGSTSFLMNRAGIRILFAGDVISSLRGEPESHSEYRRPLGTYSTYLPPRYRGDAHAYLSTLQSLRAIPVPDLVLPGHPRDDTVPQRPCLSQVAWEQLIDLGIRDLETLLERFNSDGALFLDGNPKKLLPDLYYLGTYKGAEIYGLIAAGRFFLVDAPGGSGLRQFVDARLRHLGVPPAGGATTILLTSCGAEATAGLKDMLAEGHGTVVAPSAGIDVIKSSVPETVEVIPAEQIGDEHWFQMTPITLRGRGLAPMAYWLQWGGKSVLFSGRIPIRVKEETKIELMSEISRSTEMAVDYRATMDRLDKLRPDLWLPAVATDGRNANLYDHEWEDILADNRCVSVGIVE